MEKRITGAARTIEVTDLEKKNLEIAFEAAVEGIVLLKNDRETLPLKPGKLALFGAGVKHTVKGGTGSGEVNERHAVTVYEGLQKAGFEITTEGWLTDYEASLSEAYRLWKKSLGSGLNIEKKMATPFLPPAGRKITTEDIKNSGCDTAVYVIARQAGEGADRRLEKGEFRLSDVERENLRLIAENYGKSLLIINAGAYIDLEGMEDLMTAVLFLCQPGSEGGNALAAVLKGDFSPSGKLSDTWVRSYDDVPFSNEYSFLNGDLTKEEYKEGIYVGYRYYDTFHVPVRYPFGFGLSYTTFEKKAGKLLIHSGTAALPVIVTNTGNFSGKEVAELYVSANSGKLPKERQRLVSFKKTVLLAPGESEELLLEFPLSDLASYDEAASSWVIEKGEYVLRLGGDYENTQPVYRIRMAEDAVTWKLQNLCLPGHPLDELAPPENVPESLPNLPLFVIFPDNVPSRIVNYWEKEAAFDEKTEAILNSLSEKEMMKVVVGCGLSGMTDTSGIFAPGTVGRTTGALQKKGLSNENLADGPAGLRLLKLSALKRNGSMRFFDGNYMFGFMNELPGFVKKFFNAGASDEKLYQFTTAFPVETMLAQTWNTELLEKVGAAISSEMDRYLITFWLAPALNIHKNPLCGRNFEYFSEDPLLTGRMAAALTKGVQSVPGNYVTVKHFACNNVEDNRMHSDSRVNERALREIYLKAFEICVREAAPGALMSSYNLLNGTYTPNNRELLTDILRHEWGFGGVVMTDWYSTKKGQADPALCIPSGNDLIMPGSSYDGKKIRKALRKGTMTKEQLRVSAGRVIQAVLRGKITEIAAENGFLD